MRTHLLPLSVALACGFCSTSVARAQTVLRDHERLDPDRPEAWAMHYFTATSLMTGFGSVPSLRPGQWALGAELGHVPRLSEEQRRVGFSGTKAEDLNKSPLFGRLRGLVGLPGGWVAEFGYTPPVEIDGARPRWLIAAAIGRRMVMRGDLSLSTRVFGQHGSVSGDITCPAELAGEQDGNVNPYGCRATSEDRLRMHYYGLELTAALQRGSWQWHASAAAVRTETEVQVDALTFGIHDLSRLTATDVLPAFTLGTTRRFGKRWHWGAEVLHVPLQVRRSADAPRENDPLTSVRLQLRYESD